jgi:hypothetical protein
MFRYLCAAVAIALMASAQTRADEPMVLVESISAAVTGVSPMTYVSPGTVIDLGQSTVLVLDYLGSCVKETVTGGVVHVGTRFSRVDRGSFVNTRLNCDGGRLQTAAAVSQGGVVYRAIGDPLIIRSTAPVIVAERPGRLIITRLGRDEGPVIEKEIANNGSQGPFLVDLAQAGVSLVPGVTYEAQLGNRQRTFRIDTAAAGADAPLLLRLLPI